MDISNSSFESGIMGIANMDDDRACFAASPPAKHETISSVSMSPPAKSATAQFLASIEKFLQEHPEVSVSALGKRALNDPGMILRFRSGETSPMLSTVDRLMGWMDDYARQAKRERQAAARRSRRAGARDSGA